MASNGTVKCPPPMKATSNGVFQGDNPLHYAVPLLIIQICLVVVLTRILAYLLRPLRQPRVIAEIILLRSTTWWLGFFSRWLLRALAVLRSFRCRFSCVPLQLNVFQCGYFVMRYMRQIVKYSTTDMTSLRS